MTHNLKKTNKKFNNKQIKVFSMTKKITVSTEIIRVIIIIITIIIINNRFIVNISEAE